MSKRWKEIKHYICEPLENDTIQLNFVQSGEQKDISFKLKPTDKVKVTIEVERENWILTKDILKSV